MEVEFKDKRLERIEEGGTSNFVASGVPLEIIDTYRKRIHFLRAAIDERDLRNWKSLHYEKLKGDRQGERSIRINDKWRLIFTLESARDVVKVVVLSVEDYH